MKLTKFIGVIILFLCGICLQGFSQIIIGQDYRGYNGEGLPDTATKFNFISYFCKDSAGNYYIVDQGNLRIRKSDHLTHTVHTIAGNGTWGISGDNGPASLASISWSISGICTDRNGNVFFLDSNRVRKINTTTGIITTVAGGGASVAEGVPATTAKLVNAKALCIDTNNNIYYADLTAIRKVDALTGIVTSVGGNMSYGGFGGDGGPATSAFIGSATDMTIDQRRGILYFYDRANYRLRYIDASGVMHTLAGNGVNGYSGDGTLALNSSLSCSTRNVNSIAVDTSGDVYIACWNNPPFLDNRPSGAVYGVIRKVIRSTGIITKVLGGVSDLFVLDWYSNPYQNQFIVNADETIEGPRGNEIFRKPLDRLYINRLSVSDTLIGDSCHTPANVLVGVHGTIYGVPLTADSAFLKIVWGDDSVLDISLPYYLTTDSATGASVYGFGNGTNWIPHTYRLPGRGIRFVVIKQGGSGTDMAIFDTFFIRNSCNSPVAYLDNSWTTDSVLSPPCTFPANIRSDIYGTIESTSITASSSSAFLVIPAFDSNMIVEVPLSLDNVNVYDNSYYDDTGAFFPVIDSFFLFSYHYTWFHSAPPRTIYDSYFGYEESYSTSIFTRFNDMVAGTGYMNPYIVQDCSLSALRAIGYNYGYPTSATCPNAVPYDAQIQMYLDFNGSATTLTSVPITFHFGDGSDTTVVVTPSDPYYEGVYSTSVVLRHTYNIEGDYAVTIERPAGVDTIIYNDYTLHLYNSCSPVDGLFYLDANHNCVADSGEVRLEYWPFIIVNNATGDTTNAWTGSDGHYHISLADANNYTLIPMHNEYGASATDSFVVECPSSGYYNLTASAGVSFTQDFGINIYHPVHPGAITLDMHVSGWGWGFIPGDTGVISIWSSNEWGYTGDTLSASITLTLDNHLTYLGMWDGPAPSSVVGNVLTWNFATTGSLFDFTGSVKVSCVTTATMGDTIHNTLHVTPTLLTDPDLSNNTYSWSEPVRTSWDPNEKDVSPKGFGPEGYIENGTSLSYMVHFQNTGTAPARNIKIVDTISANLDLSTLQIVNSSAPVLAFQTSGNTVQFRFNDINLSDSMDDPEGSIGYVAFNIQPRSNLLPGTRIENTAGIYFDYNDAVLTNTTVNTIEDTVRSIVGSTTVCEGSTLTLTNALAGGIWSATNSNAIVTNGIVTGIHAGVDTIVYTVYGDKSSYKIITVYPSFSGVQISGRSNYCPGDTATLTTDIAGGIWTATTLNATVNAGVVTGITAGPAIISYSVTNSCGTATDTMQVTINPLPNAGTITGINNVCPTATTTLTNIISGGSWSCSSPNATVSSGVVTGVTSGTAIISYSVTNSCGTAADTMLVTVNNLPDAGTIAGTPAVCEFATTTLTNTVTGGTWSSSTSNATITSGAVTGTTAGTTIISYSVTNVCGAATDTMQVTINPLPNAGTITGINNVCPTTATTLTNTTTGGAWSSGSPNATVSSGVVTGITAGTAIISYSVTNTCGTATDTMLVTINALPNAGTITGTPSVCELNTTTLNNTITGGTWSSSTSNAMITSGTVTGITAGTAIISYSVTNVCGTATDTMQVTINPLPDAGTITGTSNVCPTTTTTLSNTITGGSWSSSSLNATVSSGIVTGVTSGTAIISYSVTNSCGIATDTMLVTINALPNAGTITGTPSVCELSTTTLNNTITGGTWSSSTSNATVASGTVSGITAGTTIISYSVTNVCGTATDTMQVTINPLPDAGTITGINNVCPTTTTTLSNITTGGSWSSSSPDATVSSGVVTGVTSGATIISYSVTNSCGTATDTMLVTVNALPNAGTITGTPAVCELASTTLNNTITGGTWSSSTSNATVASGTVSGITAGTTIISYSVTNVCGTATDTMQVTINPLPDAGTITGINNVCPTTTTTLSNTTAGGSWSSSSPDATVSSGVVTGVTSGAAIISYSVTNSCGTATDTMLVTINSLPDAGTITGTGTLCPAVTATLSNTATGGSWSSSSPNVTVSAGVITGVTAGAAIITYSTSNSCGSALDTMLVTVSPLADAGTLSTTASMCISGTAIFTSTVSGGTWSATNSALTITSAGYATASAAGTDTVVYIVSNTCNADTATQVITVSELPVAGTITGTDTLCEGATATLTVSAGGGLWTSSNSSIATVTTAGAVTAMAPGLLTISYAVTNSCGTATATHDIFVQSAADCNVGVASVDKEYDISIYPNPSNGSFTVELPFSSRQVTITVSDISGKIMQQLTPPMGAHSVQVTMNNIPAGVYNVSVNVGPDTYHKKMVVW